MFQAALPKHPKIAKILYDAATGNLFNVLTPEEMLEAAKTKQTTRLVQFMASFRKAINAVISQPKAQQDKVYATLGEVAFHVPAPYLAAIHRRFAGNMGLAISWAQNKNLTARVEQVRAGVI